jgi:hypothetical protein
MVAPLSFSTVWDAVWHPEAYVLRGMIYATFLPVKSGISVGITGVVGVGADVAVGAGVGEVLGVAEGTAVDSSVGLTSCSAGLHPAKMPAATANLIKSRLLTPPEHSQEQPRLLFSFIVVPPNLECVVKVPYNHASTNAVYIMPDKL